MVGGGRGLVTPGTCRVGFISLDMCLVAIASVSCPGQSGRGLSFAKRMPFAVAVSVAKS